MKFELIDVSRRPKWPLWTVVIVLIWLTLGSTALGLSIYLDRPVTLCLIKRLTGVPCPTCGFTRGGLLVLQGRILQAWLYNPLLFSALGVYCVLSAIRVIFARSVRIHLTPAERTITRITVVILFFVNWAYVIFCVG